MRRYYCVTGSFDDRGHGNGMVTGSIEAETKPEGTFTSTSRKDIYTDWFDSLEEAQEFAKSYRNC